MSLIRRTYDSVYGESERVSVIGRYTWYLQTYIEELIILDDNCGSFCMWSTSLWHDGESIANSTIEKPITYQYVGPRRT
jgi:hypothetical protein